ncbi:MAG: beta-lactamase family protein [Candidatus Eremiobacteraeota bacterium]|nr:beta-lactamase family protein [Candidatus Eremiobacteraeota bacterium]
MMLSLTFGGRRAFHRRAAAFALLPLLLMGAAPPSPPDSSMDEALAAIERFAPVAMAGQQTPGLSVAITDRTKTLRIITLGYANVDAKLPVTPQTRFAIGSITKSMTALAAMQLRDEGKLDLEAPVTRYLPWFSIDSHGRPILVHQLLSHTAGIPDDFSSENSSLYDVVALRAATVLFAPGTSWSYSNDGFGTAGAVVARVDSRPWSASIQHRVFDPLGMTGSAPYFTPQTQATAALGYQWRDNDRPGTLDPPLVPSPVLDFVDPAGSVLSTPEDMARYMRLYLNGGKRPDGTRLISARSFDAMTAADRFSNGKPAGSASVVLDEAPAYYRKYGFGLSVFDDAGDHLIGHTGGVSGYTACMQMNLTRGFGVIAFANHVEAPLHPCAIVLYAMRALRAQSEGAPLPAQPVAPDPALVRNAAEYAGTYAAANGTTLRLVASASRLSLVDGTTTATLYPRDTDQFWTDDPRYPTFLLAFGRDKNKRVVDMTYGSQWFANANYHGPHAFAHPRRWDDLLGRYENTYLGQPYVTRVVIVKNRLTLDGVSPLQPRADGTFGLGTSVVRFDAYAGAQPTRLSIDDTHLYRIDLP